MRRYSASLQILLAHIKTLDESFAEGFTAYHAIFFLLIGDTELYCVAFSLIATTALSFVLASCYLYNMIDNYYT